MLLERGCDFAVLLRRQESAPGLGARDRSLIGNFFEGGGGGVGVQGLVRWSLPPARNSHFRVSKRKQSTPAWLHSSVGEILYRHIFICACAKCEVRSEMSSWISGDFAVLVQLLEFGPGLGFSEVVVGFRVAVWRICGVC